MMGHSSTPPSLLDVIIVGAGLSGLQAALTLTKANPPLTYLILEARDRIGGKTFTAPRSDHKGRQDLGAAWINDTNQSRMWELAQQFNLSTITQNTTGDVVVQDFGGDLKRFEYGGAPTYDSEEDTNDCIRIRDLVEATSQDASIFAEGPERARLDAMSFEQYIWEQGAGKRARTTAGIWTHAMLGVDPGEVSALYFLEYCRCGGGLMTMRSDCKDGGQYLRFHGGTSQFALHMMKQLDPSSLRLESPVTGISQDSDNNVSVSVGATGELLHARSVIVSIPTPVYKTISFYPPLASAKSLVVNQTRYGCYTKYILAFTKPFWREKGCCGLAQSFIGPVSVTRDTSDDDDGNYCITCFIGGTPARKWSALSAADKESSVLQQLSDIFQTDEDINKLFIEALESPWLSEQWSGWGCPCAVMAPGMLDKGWDALCAPHGNVHFVGTETARVWRGYMEGAIRSGERGALEAIKTLRKES
jgi:monoamine oxidase